MAKKSTAIDVTQGVIWQQLLSLCVPIFFSSFFQQAYTLIGTFIVGQFGGKLALGGIQATMVLTELCIGFCVGVGAGCAVITGQFFGQHDDERLSRSVHTAMTLALVGGIVFSILGIVFVEPMLVLMNTPHELLAEGVAYAAVVNGIGVVIEVNSETDFAAKTDAFMDLVKNLATVVATENPADVDALKACKYPGSNLTVTEIMQEKVMSIGENLQIRRFARFADNTSVAYVHAGGTHGVLVNLAVEGGIDATEIGKNVAMQIAAMSPKYWDKSQVPQADVDKELAVQVALMDNDPKMASKPAAVKEKIAAGKMAAFYKESCLLQQEFVRSDLYKGDVAGYIADAAKKLGGKVTFVDAVHYVKGEGIEKKADDFAAEVAAQIAGAQK